MATDFYSFPLGNCQCFSLLEGGMDYELKSMVANVPVTEVETVLQKHSLPVSKIYTPYANLVVNTGQNQVLVDTGAGRLAPTTGKLLDSMRSAGLAPEGIDSVFLTHAHPDHIGGVLDDRGDPICANATYYISQAEWEFWFSERAAPMGGEWLAKIAREKLTPLKEKIVLIEQEGEILPGVRVLFAPGHTPGHMAVSFSCRNEQLLYTADTVLHPLHLEHPDWLPVFDILPDQAQASKQRIFDLAANSGCWVLGQHFPPFPNLGHVVKRGDSWEWQPVEYPDSTSPDQ